MNRRKLIQLMGGAALLPLVAPAIATSASQQLRRLVLVELSGANDGLNTVIPFRDDGYYQLRPTLALQGDARIELNDEFALHAGLRRLMPAWEGGDLAIVHGLGYPQPNRSHFKSIALWESGSDGKRARRNGWLTHDIEHAYASEQVDAHGISLGGGMGVFTSPRGNWLSMSTASQFSQARFDMQANAESDNPALSMVLERASQLRASLDRISGKLNRNRGDVNLGNEGLAQQASHAVNLINAGIDAPVMKLTLGSFDTHENQLGRHRNLLRELAGALSGMRKALKQSGRWDDTLVITYSEFGRRAGENRSGGTDHGTAAPHLVMGGKVAGGFYGRAPRLDRLVDGDLKHTMDYRAVYSAALEQWLGLPTNEFGGYTDNRLQGLFA